MEYTMRKLLLLLWIMVSPMMAFSLFDDKGSDKEYLHLVSSIKDVTITTQKTRGLSNSFLNGNVSAQLLAYAQREQMAKDFEKIKALESQVKLPDVYVQESQALIKKAKKLNRKAFRKKPAEVFAAYTKITEGWMALNKKIIDSRFKSGNPTVYAAITMLNSTLLPLAENIGKLRGMGSGIVAKGSCEESETAKMNTFAENIEKYRVRMVDYMNANGCKRFSKRKVDGITKSIKTYVDLTRAEVISKKHITLDPNKYFDQGSASLNGILEIYDAMEGEIAKNLSN